SAPASTVRSELRSKIEVATAQPRFSPTSSYQEYLTVAILVDTAPKGKVPLPAQLAGCRVAEWFRRGLQSASAYENCQIGPLSQPGRLHGPGRDHPRLDHRRPEQPRLAPHHPSAQKDSRGYRAVSSGGSDDAPQRRRLQHVPPGLCQIPGGRIEL